MSIVRPVTNERWMWHGETGTAGAACIFADSSLPFGKGGDRKRVLLCRLLSLCRCIPLIKGH